VNSFCPVGDPLSGSSQKLDRSLVVGVVLSAGLHVLIVLALVLASMGEEGRALRPARHASATTVSLVLLPAAGAVPVLSGRGAGAQAAIVALAESAKEGAAPPVPAAPSLAASTTSQAPGAVAPVAAGTSTSLPPASTDPMLGDDYRRRLLAHIGAYRRAPLLALGVRGRGIVLLHIAIDRQGDVLSVAIATSSGVADLDEEAVATIWRARPMPPIPLALPGQLAVTLPISFDPEHSMPGGRGG